MKMLHYPKQVSLRLQKCYAMLKVGQVTIQLLFPQAPNNLELSTLERLPVK